MSQVLQADLPAVSLSDGLGGDEAEASVLAEESHGTQEEVGHQVRIPSSAGSQSVDEPFAKHDAQGWRQFLAAQERGVTHHSVEPTVVNHDVRRFDHPMQRLPALVVCVNCGRESVGNDGLEPRGIATASDGSRLRLLHG